MYTLRLGLGAGLGCCCWALALGCAPALSSFTPAHVAPKGHVQAEAGFDVSVPTGGIVDAIDAGRLLGKAASDRELTEDEQRRLFGAGAGLALNPPSAVTHLGLAYGLFERFEIGGRLTSGAWHLGARYQPLRQEEDDVDGTVSLGGGHYSYEFPLGDVIPLLKLEDFSRWQLDVGFLFGRHGSWYRVWGGPRLLQAFYGTELTFGQPEVPGVTEKKMVLASVDGSATYLAGQGGAAFGYKHVFIGFELTFAKLWTRANLSFLSHQHDVELQSFIVYPGLALLLEL